MLKSLDEHNASRRHRDQIDAGPAFNGIACPKCGGELIDSNPSMILTSDPPQKNTACLKCGYSGYRVA